MLQQKRYWKRKEGARSVGVYPTRRIAMALVPLLLSGCGVNSKSKGSAAGVFLPSPNLVRQASVEGRVVFYGSAQPARMQQLLAAFTDRFSDIEVEYRRMTSGEVYTRFLTDYAADASPDLIWNSAMSLQIKLINDGYARSFTSSERGAMPRWAVWRDQGYGVTAEPFIIAYNRERMTGRDMPTSHAALKAALKAEPERFRNRIGLLDLEDSGVGFMAYTQDLAASDNSAELYRRLIATEPRVYQTNQALIDDLTAGRIDVAYNLLGSYVRPADEVAVHAVEPSDYTLITSRIAFISARAKQPAAAQLLLDFMLSGEAELILDAQGLNAARGETNDSRPVSHLPVPVGPALLADLDQMRRQRLLRDWRAAMGGVPAPPTGLG